MVKLSLCFIEPYTLKVYGRVKVQVHAFFILVVYGGGWSAMCLGCFLVGKEALVLTEVYMYLRLPSRKIVNLACASTWTLIP